jgi:hypothetical protein
MQCINYPIELGGNCLPILHEISKMDHTWNTQMRDTGEGQIELKSIRKNVILDLEAMNVNYEIIEKGRLDDENYVRQELKMFLRRLRDFTPLSSR